MLLKGTDGNLWQRVKFVVADVGCRFPSWAEMEFFFVVVASRPGETFPSGHCRGLPASGNRAQEYIMLCLSNCEIPPHEKQICISVLPSCVFFSPSLSSNATYMLHCPRLWCRTNVRSYTPEPHQTVEITAFPALWDLHFTATTCQQKAINCSLMCKAWDASLPAPGFMRLDNSL